MIKIFKSETELAFALYSLETNKFMYGELCSAERLRLILNNFPMHDIELYVEKGPDEDLQEFFYLIPHLKDLAKVYKQRKVNVQAMLDNSTNQTKKKKPFTLAKLSLGVIIGACMLIPTSNEYKSSVLSQAQAVERMTTEFAESQPEWESVSSLYSSIESLYKEVRVESITYSSGKYKIVFSTIEKDLTIDKLLNFPTATLTNLSSQKSKEGDLVYIYELEGEI